MPTGIYLIYFLRSVSNMAVYVKNRKGTYGLSKKEFINYMHMLWQRAQARKAAREDMAEMRKEEKEKKN